MISSKTCPFAHRAEIVRILSGLENEVNVSYVEPIFTVNDGWKFTESDKVKSSANTLREVYKWFQPERTGDFSVPVLIDGDNFCTESLDICRTWMPSLFPDDKSLTEWISDFDIRFSRAHYVAGHSKTLEEYRRNFNMVFAFLDDLDKSLEAKQYIFGDKLTIADIIAYTHLCRFDPIFYDLFKLNRKHVSEYTNINKWMNRLSSNPAFSSTLDIEQAKIGYYQCDYHKPERLTPREWKI